MASRGLIIIIARWKYEGFIAQMHENRQESSLVVTGWYFRWLGEWIPGVF